MLSLVIPVFVNFRGAATNSRSYSKSLVLLPSPTDRRVPLQQYKLRLYLNQHIIDAVPVQTSWTEEQMLDNFSTLFADKLNGAG